MNFWPILDWGLAIEQNSILVDSWMQTNISAIFAAGDITKYVSEVKLIAVGFGEAAIVINNAMTYIDPSAVEQSCVGQRKAYP